jgi:ankyrin repeat protein
MQLRFRQALTLIGALALTAALAAQSAAPVADAAMAGDRAAVKTLLQQGSDVNAAQGDGMTALHWAAMKNDAELAQMLVYAGANVKATTRLGGNTPLVIAARNGSAPVVQVLVKAGADAKAATSTGTTPLMLAAASGSVDAVKTLLAAGADIEAKESSMQQTALMFAAANSRVEVMKALIAGGANVKASSKVVNLASLTSPEEEFFRQQFQQQQGPGGGAPAGQAARPAGAPAAAGPAARPAGAPAPAPAPPAAAAGGGGGRRDPFSGKAGVDRNFRYNELVGWQGGMTPLLFAVRQGSMEAVQVLLEAGADVNQVSGGDKTSPLVLAIANGHFDVALHLLDKGANPNVGSDNGVAPLYAVLNVQWAPKALYPQPRSYLQQKASYLDTMKALLDKGADPNARLKYKVWYSGYNFDLSGVDEIGATPFWRAAYASDVEAMRMLVKYGADPNIPTTKPAGRPRVGDAGVREGGDTSGLPPLPVGGPGVTALQAAAGVGYGEGFAANSHRYAPTGMMAAVKYLVEELGADVNAADHEGNTALHQAAARGDVAMIEYLVSKGADVTRVNREGQTTADMANGPVQRTQPYPEALKLLEKLGSKNNHKCVSC